MTEVAQPRAMVRASGQSDWLPASSRLARWEPQAACQSLRLSLSGSRSIPARSSARVRR